VVPLSASNRVSRLSLLDPRGLGMYIDDENHYIR
jgi:hypothetical protein